jgi:hypothetical protein
MNYSPFFLALLLVATACYTEPEFDNTPQVSFEGVQFLDMPPGVVDTLAITISFQDGNGDIGLRGNEQSPPFHFFDHVFKPDGSYLKIGELDTLPPYNCNTYRTGTISNGVFTYSATGRDTVYIRPNRFYYNFFADLYRVRNGQEIPVDFDADLGICGFTLNGRLPISIYSENGKAISGTITRRIGTPVWLPFFGNDSLKIKLRIADRELNLSNVAESPVFTLRGVQVNP